MLSLSPLQTKFINKTLLHRLKKYSLIGGDHLCTWNWAKEGPRILMVHDISQQILQYSVIQRQIQIHFKRATPTSPSWL